MARAGPFSSGINGEWGSEPAACPRLAPQALLLEAGAGVSIYRCRALPHSLTACPLPFFLSLQSQNWAREEMTNAVTHSRMQPFGF